MTPGEPDTMRHNLLLLPLLLLAGGTCAEESYSAKSLFFGEDDSVIAVSTAQKGKPAAVASAPEPVKKPVTAVASRKPAAPAHIGASYFIRLKQPDGSTRDVLANRKFKSGERFQLGVKVNVPSYIYILNEDPDGKISQIYPQPGRDNFVNAMGVVFLPSQGSFEFDNQPGTEQLLVYVSQKPVQTGMPERVKNMRPDIVSAHISAPSCTPVALDSRELISDGREYASKGINYAEETRCSADAAKPAGESYASKGIVFSDDPTPAADGQVASYVVKTRSTPDAGLFLKIKLAHQ